MVRLPSGLLVPSSMASKRRSCPSGWRTKKRNLDWYQVDRSSQLCRVLSPKTAGMPPKKEPAVLPRVGYTLDNQQDTRTVVLGTIKKLLALPEQKDVFLDVEIRFRHMDSYTTNVIADMRLLKAPEEAVKLDQGEQQQNKSRMSSVKSVKKSSFERNSCEEKELRKGPVQAHQAQLRCLPSGEFYAVHNWTRPPPRVQLIEEEHALRETGDRDDATSQDTLSFESFSKTDTSSDKTMQEMIREVEEAQSPVKKSESTDSLPPLPPLPSSPVRSARKESPQSQYLAVDMTKPTKESVPPAQPAAGGPKSQYLTVQMAEPQSEETQHVAGEVAKEGPPAEPVREKVKEPEKKTPEQAVAEVFKDLEEKVVDLPKEPEKKAAAPLPEPGQPAGSIELKPGAKPTKTDALVTVRLKKN